ncbi:tRNA (adenosine(37)-N6)-dimethylallyltransferase MiaA [Arenibacterium sp. CAU 1754]
MDGFENLPEIPADKPVLIAGPTASGKSALALRIANETGGVIVNADASQVYGCWQIITARPSPEETAQAPHALYGHVHWEADYSAGHWLREVREVLSRNQRPIIVGGTGLYFSALTTGMADIPPTPPHIRAAADDMALAELLADLDTATAARIDVLNRARVQRAWEVQKATGRSLASWQSDTPPPALAIADTVPLVFDVDKNWLQARIERRFDQMLKLGALDEVRAMLESYDPTKPAFRAIGVPELVAYLKGEMTLDQARAQATISTRQFAKRQRTWFRSKMGLWQKIRPSR